MLVVKARGLSVPSTGTGMGTESKEEKESYCLLHFSEGMTFRDHVATISEVRSKTLSRTISAQHPAAGSSTGMRTRLL